MNISQVTYQSIALFCDTTQTFSIGISSRIKQFTDYYTTASKKISYFQTLAYMLCMSQKQKSLAVQTMANNKLHHLITF